MDRYAMTALIRLALVGIAGLVLTAASCVPQNQAAPWRHEGDSIMFQYAIGGGGEAWPDVKWNAVMGASMGQCVWPGCVTPAADMAAATSKGQLPRVLIELGPNDAYADGGWTSLDVQRWTAALDALAATTCAVLVLPYAESPAYPLDLAELGQAVDWMWHAAATSANVHAIFWETYAKRPGVLGPDGLHLAGPPNPDGLAYPGPEAMDAYHDLIADAHALCP
jgi:hypothetical protein